MQCPFCKEDVESSDGHCPACRTALGAAPAGQIELTRQQRVMPAMAETGAPTALQPRKVKTAAAPARFRPRLRPPMLALCAWDDDGDAGHWTRVYSDRFVIGRTEGDLVFPHEGAMSNPHLELVREPAQGHWVWKLRDLESTNGTFVRINRATLHHGQVLLLGSGRYRFKGIAQGGRQAQSQPEVQVQHTQQWQMIKPEDVTPMLVQLTPEGEAQTIMIETDEQWVGSDPAACHAPVTDDLLLDPRHAKIRRAGREQWAIEDNDSTNGTWSMVQEIVIKDTIQFQVGEQRFYARIP